MLDYKLFKYAADGPYPEINVNEKNSTYGSWILDNVGGSNSEISAVSLYFYNSLINGKKYEEISYIFHKISIVEMHHLNIFGEISLQLGEDPRLWTYSGRRMAYWTPSYNNYTFDLSRLMFNALQGELDAINKYENQLSLIKNDNICDNLKRIILDEKLHVALFERIIQEYKL